MVNEGGCSLWNTEFAEVDRGIGPLGVRDRAYPETASFRRGQPARADRLEAGDDSCVWSDGGRIIFHACCVSRASEWLDRRRVGAE